MTRQPRRYCEGEHRWYPLNEDKDECELCDARRPAIKVQKKGVGHVAMQIDDRVTAVHVFTGDADFLRDADRRYFVRDRVEITVVGQREPTILDEIIEHGRRCAMGLGPGSR